MAYTPPALNSVDFTLAVFIPPDNSGVNFRLDEANASTSKHAYINGYDAGTSVNSSKSAYIRGKSSLTTSKQVYIKGKTSTLSSKSAYINGRVLIRSSKSAFVKGGIKRTTYKSAYINGITGTFLRSQSKPAYVKAQIEIRYQRSNTFPTVPIVDTFSGDLSLWTIASGTFPFIDSGALNVNGGDIQFNAQYDIPLEVYWTMANIPQDYDLFAHVYNDYNYIGSGGSETTYRMLFGFVNCYRTLNGITIQKWVNGSGPTDICSTGGMTWNLRSWVKAGVRHEASGNISVYVDKGNGWELKATGNDTDAIGLGNCRFQGNGDTGGPWIDNFGIGIYRSGTGKPAYINGSSGITTIFGPSIWTT